MIDDISEIEQPFESFSQILARAAIQQPTQIAFKLLEYNSSDDEEMTFQQLEQQVDSVASFLYSKFDIGDRVLLFYPTSIEFSVALLGCLAAGVVAVPVYCPPTLKSDSGDGWLDAIVEESGAKAMLTTELLADCFKIQLADIEVFHNGCLPDSAIERNFQPAAGMNAIVLSGVDELGMFHSYGLTHGEVHGNMCQQKNRFGHTTDSIMVSCLPMASDIGVLGQLLQPVFANFTSLFMSPLMVLRSVSRWLESVEEYSATTACAPPEVFQQLLEIESVEGLSLRLASVEHCYSGGRLQDTKDWDRFRNSFAKYGWSADPVNFGFYDLGMSMTSI